MMSARRFVRLRDVAVLIAVSLIADGCCRAHLPPLELYRLAIPDTTLLQTQVAMPGVPPFDGFIAIAPYDAPGVYGNRNLVFRIDDTQYGTYPNREWALPVATML